MANDDKPEAGSKGFSRSQAETLVTRYFSHQDKIKRIMKDAKKKTEGPRGDMGVVIDDAERLGINRKAFKTTLKRIAMARDAEEKRKNLEADERDALDHLEEMIEAGIKSWDDTPLGKAMAIGKSTSQDKAEEPKAAPKTKGTSATVTDLASRAGATTAPH